MPQIMILPRGQRLRLTTCVNGAGTSIPLYWSATYTSQVSLPVTVDADTTLYTPASGPITPVIRRLDGTIASDRTVNVGAAPVVLAPEPSIEEALREQGSLPVFSAAAYGLHRAKTPTEVRDALMQAIAAARPSGAGGHAILDTGPGYFTVDDIVLIYPGVLLRGNNIPGRSGGATIIRAATGSNLDAVIASRNWAENAVGNGAGYACGVTGICVDGNKANQTGGAGYGIVISDYRGFATDNVVMNARGDGIVLSSVMKDGTSQYPEGVNMAECRISGNTIENPGGHGILVNEGSIGGKITDGFMLNNIVRGNNNGTSDGIYMEQSGGWIISGNHTYSCARGGLRTFGSPATVIGNYFENYGRVGSLGTVYGLDIQAYAGGARIVGNYVWCQGDQVGPGTVPVGCRIAAADNTAAATVVFEGNILRHSVTTIAGSVGLVTTVPGGGSASLTIAMPPGSNILTGWETESAGTKTTKAPANIVIPGTITPGFIGAKPAAGKYIATANTGTSTTALSTLNTALFAPIDVPWETVIDRLGIALTVVPSATNGHMYLALYADDGTGSAPALGVSPICSGEVDTTATGDRLVTVDATLRGGRYWASVWWQATAQTTAPTIVQCTSIRSVFDALSNFSHRALQQTSVTGVPGSLSGAFGSVGTAPFIGIRVAA